MVSDGDLALLDLCRNGGRAEFAAALTAMIVRYQRSVYNAALWMLHGSRDASDVTHAVFAKVAERLDRDPPQCTLFTHVYRLLVGETLELWGLAGDRDCADHLERPDVGRKERQEGIDDGCRTPQPIRGALFGMPHSDRVVLALRHVAECSYREMGEILGCDQIRVRSSLVQARRRLAERLESPDPAGSALSASTPLINAVLDGEASPCEEHDLDRMLAADPSIRAEFDALRSLFEVLGNVPMLAAPDDLVDAVFAHLPRRFRHRAGLGRWLPGPRGPRAHAGEDREARTGKANDAASDHLARSGRGTRFARVPSRHLTPRRVVWLGTGIAALAAILALHYADLPAQGAVVSGAVPRVPSSLAAPVAEASVPAMPLSTSDAPRPADTAEFR